MLLRIHIRTLMPIRRDPKKRNFLKPGEYMAEVNRGGLVGVRASFGFYEILPGQYEVIEAPLQLFEFWRYSFRLLDAQGIYNRTQSYSAACILQSAQGKYEAAKENFEKLFVKEDVQS